MSGCALLEFPVYYYMTVGHATDFAHFMAYKEYSRIFRDFRNYAIESFLKSLVEIRQRLVEHKKPGAPGYRTGEKGSLKLSAGQRSDRALDQLGQTDHIEQLGNPRGYGCFIGFAQSQQTGRYDFADRNRKMGVYAVLLWKIAYGWRQSGIPVFVAEYYTSLSWLQEPENKSEEGSLAASVGAGNGNEIAVVYRKVHIGENRTLLAKE